MGSVSTLVNRMVYWCRDVSLGYSQADRWDIRVGGNCDCSSLVIHCLQEAGFDTGSATYTGNLSANLTARGWLRLNPNVSKKPGDILLNDLNHVAVYIGNNQLAQASISENGTAYGSDGDQTGMETNISNYYDYPWNAVLRYTEDKEEDMTQADVNVIKDKAVKNNNALGRMEKRPTHIVFQYKNALGIANLMAGTYELFQDSNTWRVRKLILERTGYVLKEWREFTTSKKSNVVQDADLNGFGVRIR